MVKGITAKVTPSLRQKSLVGNDIRWPLFIHLMRKEMEKGD